MNTQTDLAELRRLHEAATNGDWTAKLGHSGARLSLFLHRGPNSDGDYLNGCGNDVEFIAAAHNALPALLDELEAAREALSQIYWKSLELGEDRGDSTINHIAADALKGDTSPLHARDRRQKLIGAAEELERLADSTNELREMYLTEEFYGLRAFSPMLLRNSMKQRAAKLRQEANNGTK